MSVYPSVLASELSLYKLCCKGGSNKNNTLTNSIAELPKTPVDLVTFFNVFLFLYFLNPLMVLLLILQPALQMFSASFYFQQQTFFFVCEFFLSNFHLTKNYDGTWRFWEICFGAFSHFLVLRVKRLKMVRGRKIIKYTSKHVNFSFKDSPTCWYFLNCYSEEVLRIQ